LTKHKKQANILAMNNYVFEQKTPLEINKEIAKNIIRVRKRLGYSQVELSKKAGVSLGSLKRFEQSGEVSLTSLTKIAIVLEISNQLEDLFAPSPSDHVEDLFR